ncbi:Glucoamylase [Pseudonocardia sp. Ae168_Ps1]|uniref:glycoside hydrolase family 15 protein n=1 Tax=unclassified Pseudonocardia TaxID=2619320 RepID=UPI00094B6CA3|nr:MULTISPECIES: glycoside hydrolase family 15 protein [unclassified Pseudonocardia]OLL75612.1 Glucoamylase [Pseudonocardia sp. Ae150A_Ps1]OLL81609.1 Glucoamylase [Pseudonocardia sp. Ae168_Ps1]OLL84277.1 Glucoamylase [Pseudonocardia sp. Ae263_Ps1]OLL95704.1 Glucoamylase [Pseudonocardia sp. Ae356_Ps1]
MAGVRVSGAGGPGGTGYLPIAEHGIIGDLRTAALVGTDGTVDWFCPGRFDEPSVFASLLDAGSGGHWGLAPRTDDTELTTQQQFYYPDSNILITRFLTADGIVEVQDFLVLLAPHDAGHRQRLVRRVTGVRGSVPMVVDVVPRPDYAREVPEVVTGGAGIRFTGSRIVLDLTSTVELSVVDHAARAEFDTREGRTEVFVLEVDGDGPDPCDDGADDLFEGTVAFWKDWLKRSSYTGRWRERVHRSALTLKMLTHEPTGAVIASPTMALPEQLGGERNWDYRYVWMRDAAFTLYALLRLGFTEEAGAFIDWLTDRFVEPEDGAQGPLRVMYTIDSDDVPAEIELDHLEGYRGSRPVLCGNGAAGQLQLDIYGEIIDSVYLYDKHGRGVGHEDWTNLCAILEWLRGHWDAPDEGIWETRAGRQDHVFSRLMCWVAVERMIRMARRRGLPGDVGAWTTTRDEIYHQIMDRGWDPDVGPRGSFVQRYGATTLDASVLLMPMVKFCAPTEPRFAATLDAINDTLVVDTLVFRYDVEDSPDGLEGEEGTFSMCSFWNVEAMTRAGRLEHARIALEKMFSYGNHLGLYAEEIGLTGEQLGNFPQAFTHLSLISSAINLDRALG